MGQWVSARTSSSFEEVVLLEASCFNLEDGRCTECAVQVWASTIVCTAGHHLTRLGYVKLWYMKPVIGRPSS